MRYTPGPWKVRGGVDDFHLYRIEDERTGYIADVTLDGAPDENEANAHLLAAAPQLLEALETLNREAERCAPEGTVEGRSLARDAIKVAKEPSPTTGKATG